MFVWGLLTILGPSRLSRTAAEGTRTEAFFRGRPGAFLTGGLLFLHGGVATVDESSLRKKSYDKQQAQILYLALLLAG
jgi:hypothetical protein